MLRRFIPVVNLKVVDDCAFIVQVRIRVPWYLAVGIAFCRILSSVWQCTLKVFNCFTKSEQVLF